MGLKSGIMRISDTLFDMYVKGRTSDRKQNPNFLMSWKDYLICRKIIKAPRVKIEIKDKDKDLPF